MRVLTCVAVLVAWGSPAWAELPIVVPPDDTRTHAVVSRHPLALSTWFARLRDDTRGDASATWFQIGFGPSRWRLPFRGASMGALDRWTGRIRGGIVVPDGSGTLVAPLTFAAQRISVHDTLSVVPLIHLQTGIELAFSTPWLSGRLLDPSMTAAAVYSADTELVDNGWSIRPASWHVRTDALVCRSIYAELGVGPELFRSTAHPERSLDYGVRWHAGFGFSLACRAFTRSFLDDLTVVLQYSARALLYNHDAAPSYDDRLQLALQLKRDRWAVAAMSSADARLIAVRVQRDFGGPDR
jgi:hypothetical protein